MNGEADVGVDRRLRGHMPSLDGVRGLAILMVLALHFVGDTVPTNRLERLVTRVCGFGMFGVDLFFVLSGFLITGILIEAKGSRRYFRTFYARRALRIFPLYYGVLACTFFVAPALPWFRGGELDALRGLQAWAWLYAVNVLTAIRGVFSLSYLDHFWSLAVEEHFYLFWPLIVWACSRAQLVRVSAAIALLSLSARIALAPHMGSVALYVLTPFRLDALCLGGLLAAHARGPGGLDAVGRIVRPAATIAATTLVGSYAFNRLTHTLFDELHEIRNATFVLLLAALMVSALTAPITTIAGRLFRANAMRFLGKYSYGLYVFHHFFSYYFVHHRTEFVVTGWVGSHTLAVVMQASVGFLASLGISLLSYHFFEMRFLALKRFWQTKDPIGAPRALPHPSGRPDDGRL